jgi:hypothetical protein
MVRRKRHGIRLFLALVGIYALVGYFILPGIVRTQLEQRLHSELGRTVSIGRVRINPFTLSATLERVDIRTADGRGSMLSWLRLRATFDLWRSVRSEWVLSEFTLDGLQAVIDVAADGTVSFSDIVDRVTVAQRQRPATPEGRPWRIRRIDVANARISFTDRSRAEVFQTLIGPVNFTVLQFSTAGGQGAPLRLDALTESGERFSWLGTLSARPLSSTGDLRVEKLMLPKYAPYLESRLKALVASGQIDASARYDFNLKPGDRKLRVSDGMIQLKQLRINERTGTDILIDLPAAEISGINVDVFQPKVEIKNVKITGGRAGVRRASDGTINLLSLVPPQGAVGKSSPGTPGQSAPEKPLDFTLGDFKVSDFAVGWDDLSGPRPVHGEIADLKASAKNITLTEGGSFPVDFAFRWMPEGSVAASGNITLRPNRLELDVEASGLALLPLGVYLEHELAVHLVRGAGSLKGHFTAAMTTAGPMEMSFSGGGSVDDFALNTIADDQELVGWTALSVGQAKITSAPRLIASLGEIKLRNPFLHVVIDAEKKVNVLNLRVPSLSAAEVHLEAQAPATELPVNVSVGAAEIEGGAFTLADRSVQPAVQIALQQFGGSLKNMSSDHVEGGEVNLHSVVNGSHPIKITGHMNPFQKNPVAELTFEAEELDLAPFAPYIGKYAGYELQRGKLSVNNHTKLIDQQLEMQNTLRLDQFTLGRPTGSPDAVKLPVRLGVALLKDAEGKIILEVPVKGSLQDPHFQVSNVVGEIVSNAITKAAKSPFTLLGALFGGGGEELGQQEFAPGGTVLTSDGIRRLTTVQRALIARPELDLELQGGYDVVADTYALKRSQFEARLNQRIMDERSRRAGGGGPSAEPITEAERGAMVRRMFDESFPVLTRFSKPLPPPPGVQVPEAPAHRGLVKRTVDIATMKAYRDRRASRKALAEAQAPDTTTAPLVTAQELPVAEMMGRLAEITTITPEDLTTLADARAARVKEALTAEGKIPAERITMAKTAGDVAAAKGPRVTLSLR